MSQQKQSLPSTTGSVQVQLLDGGSLGTADISKVHAGAAPNSFRLYDWCFYIHHPSTGRHVLWDLGITSDKSCYTPWVLKIQYDETGATGPRRSLASQLEDRGIKAEQIDTILFSHAHWDHCRPFSQEFPHAKGWFGPMTEAHCAPGHLENGKPTEKAQWDGRIFDRSGHATEKYGELEGPWVRFGLFESAMDFFGDGSFWIIEAPGHMPGNLCAAVKLEGSDSWVMLGSDCCHSYALLEGKEDIAVFKLPDGSEMSLHSDIGAAKSTLRRMREAEQEYGVRIALAHDAEWMKSADNNVLMSLLSDGMKGEWLARVRSGEMP